jgi:hydroxymethylglutaryl-CoA reductase
MKSMLIRVNTIERTQKDDKEIKIAMKKMSDRIEYLEDIIENKIGYYIPARK